MNHLITTRLYLRDWQENDKAFFAKMNASPTVMQYFPHHLTEQESNNLVDNIQKRINENGFGFFAVEHRKTGNFMGFIGLNVPRIPLPFTLCVEIGWRLETEFWGKGYATEGAIACLDYAFSILELDSVVSFTAQQNTPSQKVMQRLNMYHEGDFNHPMIDMSSSLCKHVLYRITKEKFLHNNV